MAPATFSRAAPRHRVRLIESKWAEMSSKATNAQRETVPDIHVLNAILSTDAAKIRKDAEIAIQNNAK